MDPDIFKAHAPVLAYQFKAQKTKKIDLVKYVAAAQSQESIDNLKLLQEHRDELVAVLAKRDKIAKEVMQGCEAYFPHLYSLVVATEAAKGRLRVHKDLNFQWSSALSKDTSSSVYCLCPNDVQFEAIMVCVTYGFAHINRASELTISCSDDDFPDVAPNASKLLKTAAGIFDYVVERELPRWKNVPEDRPLETSAVVLKALSKYACSIAQALAVKKALLGEKTSRLVMAKLQKAVWDEQAQFEKTLRALPEWRGDKIQAIFKSFVGLQVGLAKSNTYRYTGEDVHENGKIGFAVAFLTLAGKALAQVWTPNANSKLGRYTEEIAKAKNDIEHIVREYELENSHINLEKVPIEAELDLPEAKMLITPEPWMPPRPLFDKFA